MLKAVDIAEKVMPYRHHRLAAIKLDKDLTPRKEQKSLSNVTIPHILPGQSRDTVKVAQ